MSIRDELWQALADGAKVRESQIWRAIDALIPTQREAVLLRLKGFKQTQIASMLGINQSRVSRRLKAGYDNIAGMLLTMTTPGDENNP